MKYKNLSIILLLITLFLSPMSLATASAHRSGCHRYHSCPSDSGSYVCGDLGYSSGCGTSNFSEPVRVYQAPTPHIPLVTTKTISDDTTVPFNHTQKTTGNEYTGYTKIFTAGATGVKRTNTEITYSDGIETTRKITGSYVVTQPVDEVTSIGNRMKPTANLTAVGITKKKDKFDIKGHSPANSTVVLSVNGKRIKRVSSDSKGLFIFKNIKLTNQNTKIVLYSRINGKEIVISEPYTLIGAKHSPKSEYDLNHK